MQENIEKIFTTLDLAMFLRYDIKSTSQQNQIDEWDYIQLKNLCASKDIIYRVKRQPMKYEKIFAKLLSDKGLIARMYKALL